MTMPKKGRRQVVIDEQTYFYMIKPYFFGAGEGNGANLTVEFPDGTYKSEQYEEAITPAMVEAFIRAHSQEDGIGDVVSVAGCSDCGGSHQGQGCD